MINDDELKTVFYAAAETHKLNNLQNDIHVRPSLSPPVPELQPKFVCCIVAEKTWDVSQADSVSCWLVMTGGSSIVLASDGGGGGPRSRWQLMMDPCGGTGQWLWTIKLIFMCRTPSTALNFDNVLLTSLSLLTVPELQPVKSVCVVLLHCCRGLLQRITLEMWFVNMGYTNKIWLSVHLSSTIMLPVRWTPVTLVMLSPSIQDQHEVLHE